MRARAISGWLGLLLLTVLVTWSQPAAARTPASVAKTAVVADSGFRPLRNGYGFPNYVNQVGRPNLGSGEMRRLFGDAVCAGFNAGACVLSPPALAWMQQENASMAGGHCFGFSVSALLFWARLNDPSRFGAAMVPRLGIRDNRVLAREIAYGHAFQLLPSVVGAQVSSSPRAVLEALISGLGRSGELYTLGVVNAGGWGGHAVTPYAVRRLARNRYAILVYDNNFPRQTRKVLVNTKTDTWSYRAAQNPHAPASLYTGNAATQSLLLLPARPGVGVQPCPFCSPLSGSAGAAMAAAARGHRAALQAIRLQTSGPISGHLLITDRRGRRIGFVHGRLVNEIPGARIVRVLVGATRTWLQRIEPQYEVPTGRRYRIRVTAAGGGRERDARPQATVTVLEPGFLAAARSITMTPGQRARLRLSADGHTMSFVRPRGGRQPMLVIGNAAPGANDYQWNVRDQRRSTGKPVPISLDVAARNMRLTGSGRYDLSMDMVSNAVSVFTHHRLRLGVRVTGVFDYGDWTDGESMPLTLIKGGRVIGRRLLTDESSPPPNTTIDRNPSQTSNSASASFEFSGSGVASFECKLDRGSFAPCTSPKRYGSLADGRHTFAVRAIDRAGRADDTPPQFTWVVDATGPTLVPTISPTPTYLDASASAAPNAADGGTGVASQGCAGVATSSVGDHAVRCTATDNAGNVTGVTVHYTVQYRILGLFPPAPNSKWKAGQTVPIKVALANAAGLRIPDATAADLVGDPCKVEFSASGAQAQPPTCMKYDPACDQFIYDWKLGDAVGDVTFEVRVNYGTGTTTPLSRTITVVE